MNTEQEHQAMVDRLAKSPDDILNELTPHKVALLHMSSKLCSEAGELMDGIGKMCYYDKELDVENVIEELGDMEFYMYGIRKLLALSREETLRYNIRKLEKRYPKGYSNKAAIERADKQ